MSCLSWAVVRIEAGLKAYLRDSLLLVERRLNGIERLASVVAYRQ